MNLVGLTPFEAVTIEKLDQMSKQIALLSEKLDALDAKLELAKTLAEEANSKLRLFYIRSKYSP